LNYDVLYEDLAEKLYESCPEYIVRHYSNNLAPRQEIVPWCEASDESRDYWQQVAHYCIQWTLDRQREGRI
jgi:hypothetical protein